MSMKNVYLFKVNICNTNTNIEIPLTQTKQLFDSIFNIHKKNDALNLTRDNEEPIMLDILENTDKYLFARLCSKRPNNSLQKRNYENYTISDVLRKEELEDFGIELFTYCILGYSHGILSVANAKGAPSAGTLARIFKKYNNEYTLETTSIPNKDIINELLDGTAPTINRISVDIPQPDAQILQDLFGFGESEIFETIRGNATSIVFDVKPRFREALCDDANLIKRLHDAIKSNKDKYNSVILSGKPDNKTRQREYDLYEEYFKYPISISEYQNKKGKRVEKNKELILSEYRNEMMNIYNNYKDVLLAICNR